MIPEVIRIHEQLHGATSKPHLRPQKLPESMLGKAGGAPPVLSELAQG